MCQTRRGGVDLRKKGKAKRETEYWGKAGRKAKEERRVEKRGEDQREGGGGERRWRRKNEGKENFSRQIKGRCKVCRLTYTHESECTNTPTHLFKA